MSDSTQPAPAPNRAGEKGAAADSRQTPSGLPLAPYPETGGERPGEFPFTRGVHETMYRGRLWTMRQYSGFGTARQTNERFRYLLDHGQSGLSVAFDLPTQIGFDSDDPTARGEVGKVGVPISTLEDMEELFDGIALDHVSVSMTINSSAAVLLALMVALARRRGVDPASLRGTLQNDILKEFVARHTQRFPLQPSMRLVIDALDYSARELPRWNPISISGYHIREAGSTAVEEVAFTLAHAIAYLEAARERGVALEPVARRVSFFFNAQMHLFEEIAKFRAARRLWAFIVRDRFGIDDPGAARLRFHTQTAGAALTYREQENNIVRVTVQALAAVLGGTQSLHTNAADEALGLPTERSVRTALRTQQILAHETGVADVADPLGGSPLIEELTDGIAEKASDLIARIDKLGGAMKAVEEGTIQRWIEDSAYRYQLAIERGERVVVGVNQFCEGAADSGDEVFTVDPDLERERIETVERRKASRSDAQRERIGSSLQSLREIARGTDNLLPALIDCCEAGASVGEMMGTLAAEFGEYQGDL